VLQKLGAERKRATLHFLFESGLIGRQLVVRLVDADLSGAYLVDAEGVSEEQLEQASLMKGTTTHPGKGAGSLRGAYGTYRADRKHAPRTASKGKGSWG
jgi:hypothetical protein